MYHSTISLKNLTLSFPHKTCFEDFSYQIPFGSRIAIIGRNGSGKTSLLKMLHEGGIDLPNDVITSLIPQTISEFGGLSGGERFNAALTKALSNEPNLLLLDEPTNHLDRKSRQNLFRLLNKYQGTLIIVTHDPELIRNCIDTIFHIENEKVHVFAGSYDDYILEMKRARSSIENKLRLLNQKKISMHDNLMQEQERSSKSREQGKKKVENRKWLKSTGDLKAMKAEKAQGKKYKLLGVEREALLRQLEENRLPEVIVPKFNIEGIRDEQVVLQISNGAVWYNKEKKLVDGINVILRGNERLAVVGGNGSGKSTIVKAILGCSNVFREGSWYSVKPEDIGFLDQHYNTLEYDKTVYETISSMLHNSSMAEVRKLLNDFLFRKNEEVNCLVSNLSGGEKVRLSLAQIAMKTPKLLILDEVTNNIDLQTRQHVIEVLNAFPGAILVISHDEDFLQEIGIEERLILG